MSAGLNDELPEPLKTVRTRPLFVDPASYYFRILPMFECAAPQYDWINRIVAVGAGYRRATGPVYSVFEVL